MKLARAAIVGALGALLVVLLLLAAQWLLGAPTDMAAVLGTLVVPAGGAAAWVAGAAAQTVVGAVAGVLYAVVFEYVFRRAGLLAGLAVALPHVAIAGLATGFLPVWLGADTEPVPGAFLGFGGGLAAACFVGAHLLFGALVGWAYGETRHRAAPPAPTWRELRSSDAEGAR